MLHYRQFINATAPADRDAADGALQQDLAAVRAAALVSNFGKPQRMDWHLSRL